MLSKNAYAKINLTLEIIRKFPSGYHEIRSIMQQLELHDTVSIKKRNSGIIIECDNPEVPLDQRNIAYKAAQLMLDKYNISNGVEIDIKKRIPISAGLSGGSTDAGSVMLLLSELYNLKITEKELIDLSSEIGMDVPFSILGDTAMATGRGEILKKIDGKKMDIVLINPGIKISTKEAYADLNLKNYSNERISEKMQKAIKKGDIKEIAGLLQNDFESSIVNKYLIITKIKNDLITNGALNAVMSGSGSSVFGIFSDSEIAQVASIKLCRKYPFVVQTITR